MEEELPFGRMDTVETFFLSLSLTILNNFQQFFDFVVLRKIEVESGGENMINWRLLAA